MCSFVFGLLFLLTGTVHAASDHEVARGLLQRAGLDRGICAVVGLDDDVALEIADTSKFLVHARDSRPDVVTALRKKADAVDIGIDRLAVEQGGLNRLPYADNMIDLVVATHATADLLRILSVDEVLRALRPGGTAIIGTVTDDDLGDEKLAKWNEWAKSDDIGRLEVYEDSLGSWIQFLKPALQGADEWTHWEHAPDNNPVSTDFAIKAPYMTQFLNKPYYIAMPSVTLAAGGRTFLAIGHIAHHPREWDTLYRLIACSGYNGTVLWERKLPEGYLVHRSGFIATADTFYLADGNHCVLLDPQTGNEKGEIRIPGVRGEWKWMAMKDGKLYVVAGKKEPGTRPMKGDRTPGGWSWMDLSAGYYTKPRIPFGFGHTLAAYDLEKKQILWTHREDKDKPIDSRGMALDGKKVLLYSPDAHFRCLDAATGQILWTNDDAKVLELVEEPGKGLTSTPGFRTACMAVLTPKALIVQGQTRMNVTALSTEDGSFLWTRKKITNNPNAIFVDGNIVLGIGPGGNHEVIEPVSGEVKEILPFRKTACTRLTATPDSFLVRGEGTLRFDRYTKKVLVDGAVRPACNDGAVPANGMLYLGPWQCDCNLSLVGRMAKCSAGNFRFDETATEGKNLQVSAGGSDSVAPFSIAPGDWPTYRGDVHRTAGTKVELNATLALKWKYKPDREHVPTVPVSAGGLVFVSGGDGIVRALDSADGKLRWEFATPGPIKSPPTIADGRAYVGSGDGHVYCLEAATGRQLWRFRAAPIERHIRVFDSLSSTWPVNSGVLVKDGVAYFAAGIIDYDGTHLYALDALTGRIKWQNHSSGHLNKELRKGVSAQGNLTIHNDWLLLAGGNQVSPAAFELKTGKCLAKNFDQGHPKANGGKFVGVFRDRSVIAGGRVLYSAPENVSTKGSFVAFSKDSTYRVTEGGIPPAWSDDTLAFVHLKFGKLTCCDTNKVVERIDKGVEEKKRFLSQSFPTDGAVRWETFLGEENQFEVVSIAVGPNAVVAALRISTLDVAQPRWSVVGFDIKTGDKLSAYSLHLDKPLPGGLLVDRDGRVIVTLLDGSVVCLGG